MVFGKAAAGDRIAGTLLDAVHDRVTQRTLLPAGSKVSGRLTRVELKHSGSGEYTIAYRWEYLEAEGGRVPLNLKPSQPLAELKAAGRRVLMRRGMDIELPHSSRECRQATAREQEASSEESVGHRAIHAETPAPRRLQRLQPHCRMERRL